MYYVEVHLLLALAALLGGLAAVLTSSVPRVRTGALTGALVLAALLVDWAPSSSVGPWRVDALSRLLVSAVAVLGCVVGGFAVRQFEAERRGRRLVAATLLVSGAAMATAVAHTLLTLTLMWVATSIATALLISWSVESPHWGLAERTRWSLAAGDAPLVLSVAWITASYGNVSLSPSTFEILHPREVLVLAATGSWAAIMRAGFTLRRSWVTETVEAPTSVSALLHAGVVNAGALLLIRLSGPAPAPAVVRIVAALACAAVMVALAPVIIRRVDLKGQLATSTVSQMAFMLLAFELGWPALAVTHVVGHALYKSFRFMDAGSATARRAALRRLEDRGELLDPTGRRIGVAVLVVAAGAVALAAPLDARAVAGVFALASIAVWWARTRRPLQLAGWLLASLAATVVGYALTVALLAKWLAGALGNPVWSAPWWSLGTAVVVVTLWRHHRDRVVARPLRAVSDVVEVGAPHVTAGFQ